MSAKFYENSHVTLYNSDCRSMPELPDETVQCVVTSPPYWGLRKYEGDQELIWGGDASCEHEWGDNLHRAGYRASDTNPGKLQSMATQNRNVGHSNFCQKCGAWKGSFGLEPTPELYVQHTVEIMREIKRVLRKDGVVFWNIGDSYASSPPGNKVPQDRYNGHWHTGGVKRFDGEEQLRSTVVSGLKPKDMCLIPFRVAIALQESGWWVRSVICWHKPNPMPESVNGWRWEKHKIKVKKGIRGTQPYSAETGQSDRVGGKPKDPTEWIDCPGCEKCLPNGGYVLRKGSWRPTNTYEHILMLTKSSEYYCDALAVREVANYDGRKDTIMKPSSKYSARNIRNDGDNPNSVHQNGAERWPNKTEDGERGRNLRDVWTFPTQPFPGAHFAVFPEKLPELCIKAATSEKGCCPKCGAPWARVIDRQVEGELEDRPYCGKGQLRSNGTAGGQGTQHSSLGQQDKITRQTVDWRPTCNCGLEETTPCTVLDPFAGSATSLLVAQKLQRKAVGYELSKDYCKLDEARLRSYMPLWERVK